MLMAQAYCTRKMRNGMHQSKIQLESPKVAKQKWPRQSESYRSWKQRTRSLLLDLRFHQLSLKFHTLTVHTCGHLNSACDFILSVHLKGATDWHPTQFLNDFVQLRHHINAMVLTQWICMHRSSNHPELTTDYADFVILSSPKVTVYPTQAVTIHTFTSMQWIVNEYPFVGTTCTTRAQHIQL